MMYSGSLECILTAAYDKHRDRTHGRISSTSDNANLLTMSKRIACMRTPTRIIQFFTDTYCQ